jgi:hypothetical protein
VLEAHHLPHVVQQLELRIGNYRLVRHHGL